jgi:hypothetical protein
MHVTWLVSDPHRFFENPGPTSPSDRVVPGLTYREWYELFFVVLGADGTEYGPLSETDPSPRPDHFDNPIPEYPMLSYINGVYLDAVFESDEVQALEDECIRLAKSTSSPLALSGLQKLLKMCAEARTLGLCIYMMCD